MFTGELKCVSPQWSPTTQHVPQRDIVGVWYLEQIYGPVLQQRAGRLCGLNAAALCDSKHSERWRRGKGERERCFDPAVAKFQEPFREVTCCHCASTHPLHALGLFTRSLRLTQRPEDLRGPSLYQHSRHCCRTCRLSQAVPHFTFLLCLCVRVGDCSLAT